MSRQQHYADEDPEAHYPAGQQPHDSYYEQDYDARRDYDPRQSGRSDGQYQDYDDGNYSRHGDQYYEGSEVGEGYYHNGQRDTYNSQDSRADYYRQDAYADDYPDAYPAGVDPAYGTQHAKHSNCR